MLCKSTLCVEGVSSQDPGGRRRIWSTLRVEVVSRQEPGVRRRAAPQGHFLRFALGAAGNLTGAKRRGRPLVSPMVFWGVGFGVVK